MPASNDTIGSTAVTCLETAWRMLQAQELDLPNAVIILASAKDRRKVRGYFWSQQWKTNEHEVAINPVLFAKAEETLATLVHEAAHAISHKLKIQDCRPPSMVYHNKYFKSRVESLGMVCKAFPGQEVYRGFAYTVWPEEGPPNRYSEILQYLRDNLPKGLEQGLPRAVVGTKGKQGPRGKILVTLECSCREIRVHKDCLDGPELRCSACDTYFTTKEEGE